MELHADTTAQGVMNQNSYWLTRPNLLSLGELRAARQASEQGLALFHPLQHQSLVSVTGINTGAWAEAQMAWGLWLLGYPDQALERSQHAAQLARELGHGNTSGVTLYLRGMTVAQCHALGDLDATTEAVIHLCTEHGIPAFLAAGIGLQGWGRVRQGQWDEGLAQLRQGITDYQATGGLNHLSWGLGLLADAYRTAGRIDEGLAALTEAFAFVEQTGERVYEAELYRLRGELMLLQSGVQSPESRVTTKQKAKGKTQKKLSVSSSQLLVPSPQPLAPNPHSEAEVCFLKAIEIAQRQQAKSLELRAAISLARLWQQQGKRTEAHQMLSAIYGWFTEGFDTKDLQEAKVLLDQLAEGQ